MQESYSRRAVLRFAMGALGTAALAACGGSTKQANTNGGTRTTGAEATTSKNLGFENPNKLSTPSAQTGGSNRVPQTGGGTQPVQASGAQSGTTVSGGTTAVATQGAQPTLPAPKTFKESPELTKQVKAGKLPKVEQRLPTNPLVVKPSEATGMYGGTLELMTTNPQGSGYEPRVVGYENLVRWRLIKGHDDLKNFSYGLDDIVPNVAESYEIKTDGKEYVFHLREGMKWSDGQPYTADDIMFLWEDVWSNTELSPGGPASWMKIGGKTGKIEKLDDHTVAFRFPIPNGLFLSSIAGPGGGASVGLPKHYLKQFHKKYNPDVVKEAKKQNLKSWADLFGQMNSWTHNKELPVLFGWHFNLPIGASPQHWQASRNPYYFKVDTEGNQLPYLDDVNFKLVTKPQVMTLDAFRGEIDVVTDYVNELQNKPLFYKNRQKGNYHLYDLTYGIMNTTVIALNLTHNDKHKRKIFNDKNFRIGLSYAINRQEIIDTVYQGQGEPYQAAPRPESPFYNKTLATQYTAFDPKQANVYLDKVLPKKDSQGKRLGPDGKPFTFQLEYAGDFRAEWSDVLELVQHRWAQVGIQMNSKDEARNLLYTRKGGNEADATVWTGGGGLPILPDPRWYFPYSGESNFAIPWANWFSHGGLLGKLPKQPEFPVEKPPDVAIRQMKLYDQIRTTADAEKQVDLMNQILRIAQQQFWALGVVVLKAGYGATRNYMHNVPGWMLWDYIYQCPAVFNVTTWSKTQK